MAKYEDYVKNDQLDQELADVEAAKTADEDTTIPERFRGKTVAEVAQAYMELQSMSSRQAQDLGTMRKTVDELLELKLPTSGVRDSQPSKTTVTTDDIYDRPDEVIRKVVKEESNDRIQKLEQELQQERVSRAMGEFTKQFPDWQKDAASPEMLEWIKSSPYRMRTAAAADKGDLDAAAELFGNYYDTRKVVDKKKEEQTRAERKRKVLDAGLETSGGGVPTPVESYSRSALMEKRIAAKRGDSAAQRWLDANSASIQQAYAEGRVVD